MNESDGFLTTLLETAEAAAHQAGALQMKHFRTKNAMVIERSPHDIKINVDRQSEEIIRRKIQSSFPTHAVFSEETGLGPGKSRYRWIVDPLDGTVNYYVGLPLFCICIACYRMPEAPADDYQTQDRHTVSQGNPLLGVVYAPYLDWMFSAVAGKGAVINGRRIQNHDGVDLREAVVGISFGKTETTIRRMETINSLLVHRVKKVRILGATGLDIAQVADGVMSAIIQPDVCLWDFAAAGLILQESGGALEARPNPGGGWQIIAAAKPLLQPIKEMLAESLA